ncbi:hypothetical protein DENSPDRAFT_662450 [Dentipellis sp. KUC8613]|nr:hypothetical protein DENSPDRAFT_662450 [Dentipellis sp. KUC8613]
MINRPQPGQSLHKLVFPSPASSSQSTPRAMVAMAAPAVDDSTTNASSIVTLWNEPPKLPLVTTGDAIGSHVLHRINELRGPDPSAAIELGIFKVPHHGSQYNSQIDRSYDMTATQSTKEKDHFAFLACVAWYVQPTMDPGDDRDLVGTIMTAVMDDFSDDWMAMNPSRNIFDFAFVMGDLASRFSDFLSFEKFTYHDNASSNPILHLADKADLAKFALLLIHRHIEILAAIYANLPDAARERRAVTMIGSGVLSSESGRKFDWKDFMQYPHVPLKLPTAGQAKRPVGVEIEPQYESLYDLLHVDPGAAAQYQMGIFSFYERFRANNYIISANGTHGHPHPNLVGGLMAAAISRTSGVSRLFVTDGASVRMDLIRVIVIDLLKGRFGPSAAPNPKDWKQRIRIFYLDTDFCAAVPLDLADVSGCREIDFGASEDAVDARRVLHQQMVRAAAYDLPRAAEPATATFSIAVKDLDAATVTFNSVTYDASTTSFKLGGSTPSTFRLEPTKRSTASAALNQQEYKLYDVTGAGAVAFPMGVLFQELTNSSSTDGVLFKMVDAKIEKVLSYASDDDTALLMQDISSASASQPVVPAQLRFVRKSGYASASSADTASQSSASASRAVLSRKRRDLSAQMSADVASDDVERQQESSADGQTSSNPQTLADVAKTILGALHASVALALIPKAPFVLADVAQYPAVVLKTEAKQTVYEVTLKSVIAFSDVAGLGSMPVRSLRAILSSSEGTLKLEAEMDAHLPICCSFLFDGTCQMLSYLLAIDYSKIKDDPSMAIAAVGSTIVGRDRMTAFFAALPASVSESIAFPTWLADIAKSEIDFTDSPLGVDVRAAAVRAVIPDSLKDISIGGLQFSVSNGALRFQSVGDGAFRIAMDLAVTVSSSGAPKLELDMHASVAAHNPQGPVILDFRASAPTAPLDFLRLFGLDASHSSIDVPLGGKAVDLRIGLDCVGATLVQPCSGTTSVLHLETIYFHISADWEPWKEVVPDVLHPPNRSSVALSVILLQPKTSPFAVALELDYSLNIAPEYSDIHFRLSYWPNKGTSAQRMSVSLLVDPMAALPPPTLDAVLSKFFSKSWQDITAAFPLLGSLTEAISMTEASLEIGKNCTTTAFSIGAKVLDLAVLSQPSLILENADLSLQYSGNVWTGQLTAQLLFANKYRSVATLILPTKHAAGSLEFRNLDEDFTFGKMVSQIDSAIDVTSVPIVGSSIASVRLDSGRIQLETVNDALTITSFEIDMAWGQQSVAQLNTSASRLIIGWQKTALLNVPSVAGAADTAAVSNHWTVHWEGSISDNWHLSADLQYSNIRLSDDAKNAKGAEGTELLVVSGAILNIAGDLRAGDLTDVLTSSADKQSALWKGTLPQNVGSNFSLRQCALNCALGKNTTVGVAAQASWGQSGRGTAALVVQRVEDSSQTGSPWAFALAIGVQNFRFADILSDSQLAAMVDSALSRLLLLLLVSRICRHAICSPQIQLPPVCHWTIFQAVLPSRSHQEWRCSRCWTLAMRPMSR